MPWIIHFAQHNEDPGRYADLPDRSRVGWMTVSPPSRWSRYEYEVWYWYAGRIHDCTVYKSYFSRVICFFKSTDCAGCAMLPINLLFILSFLFFFSPYTLVYCLALVTDYCKGKACLDLGFWDTSLYVLPCFCSCVGERGTGLLSIENLSIMVFCMMIIVLPKLCVLIAYDIVARYQGYFIIPESTAV